MLRVLVATCCALCLCATASAESAVLRRPSLHWVRGEDAQQCVDPRTLSERVEELVGPVLVRAPEAEHTVEAHIARVKPKLLRVHVRVLNLWGAKVGERIFDQAGSDCAALTPAISFVIAMMIDPDVAAHGLPPALVALLGGEEPAEDKLKRELEGEPAAVEEAPELPPPAIERPRVVQRAELRVPPRPAEVQQLAVLARAALHEAARGTLGLEARYLHRVARPWLDAGGYIRGGRQRGLHSVSGGRSLAMSTLDVGVQACAGQPTAQRLRLQGCLGAELTTAFATGDGFLSDSLQVSSTGAAVSQLTARLQVWKQFGVMLALNLRAALSQRDIQYKNGDGEPVVVYRVPILSGGVALGPSLEF